MGVGGITIRQKLSSRILNAVYALIEFAASCCMPRIKSKKSEFELGSITIPCGLKYAAFQGTDDRGQRSY